MDLKLGISSYCLWSRLERGWTIFDIMDWAKAHGCAHMELVPFGLPFLKEDGSGDFAFAGEIRRHAEEIGLPLSAFSLNACVIRPGDERESTQEKYEKELARIKLFLRLAHKMGIPKMRHDTCSGQHPLGRNTPEQFEEDFPVFVSAVREVADFAKTLDMSTTLENHGLYVNGADRLIRILRAAGRDNVGLTVDVGNYLCVDEDPVVAVAKTVPYADMIHLKDFYVRSNARMLPQDGMYVSFPKDNYGGQSGSPERPTDWDSELPSLGYVGTAAGNKILRGAIVGQGDMDLWAILSILRDAGYDREISLEFEGMEDCEAGTAYGLQTAHFILEKLGLRN